MVASQVYLSNKCLHVYVQFLVNLVLINRLVTHTHFCTHSQNVTGWARDRTCISFMWELLFACLIQVNILPFWVPVYLVYRYDVFQKCYVGITLFWNGPCLSYIHVFFHYPVLHVAKTAELFLIENSKGFISPSHSYCILLFVCCYLLAMKILMKVGLSMTSQNFTYFRLSSVYVYDNFEMRFTHKQQKKNNFKKI